MKIYFAVLCLLGACCIASSAFALVRYEHSGDGVIALRSASSGVSFRGRYRDADGNYDAKAMAHIQRVMGAPNTDELSRMSVRLIEYLDQLQDELRSNEVIVRSGFRSFASNKSLNANGPRAGKASMHLYGMAADVEFSGVSGKKAWNYIRQKQYGGVGNYGSNVVHVDVGPARFWERETSKVGTDAADDNKLILLMVDQDRYFPGEGLRMRFVRVTAWPVGVLPTMSVERQRDGEWKKVADVSPQWPRVTTSQCIQADSLAQLTAITWTIPADLDVGTYRLRAYFCDNAWEAMPREIATDPFTILNHQ